MNKNKLISKMKLYGDTNAVLAKAISLSPQRLSAKINETGGAEFTQSEISNIRERYRMTDQETAEIFFA